MTAKRCLNFSLGFFNIINVVYLENNVDDCFIVTTSEIYDFSFISNEFGMIISFLSYVFKTVVRRLMPITTPFRVPTYIGAAISAIIMDVWSITTPQVGTFLIPNPYWLLVI